MVVGKFQPITSKKSEQEHRLDLLGGGSIEFWSLVDPDSSRGRKYKAVTINEAGLMKNLAYAWNNVISPTLIDMRGGAMFAFTPKGMNDIYRIEMQATGDPVWAITHESSYANPFIPADELDLRKRTLPEAVYNQEILAEYIADSGMVFRHVMAAATIDEPIPPKSGGQYVIGVDWGKSNDFTVITVMDIETKTMVAMDRFNQIDYNVQMGRLMAWVDRYKPVMLYPEANSMGAPLIDTLRSKGVPICNGGAGFTTTNATKSNAIEALSLAFEREEIKIFNDPILIAELQAYEVNKTHTGLMSYSAPEGMHDDCVMALALAYAGITRPSMILGEL
jgi:hypothetical protein